MFGRNCYNGEKIFRQVKILKVLTIAPCPFPQPGHDANAPTVGLWKMSGSL